VTRFYCERWTGLSIWAHALRRMIAFQGGYLNTEDPAEAAFIRSTDYFKRGLIVEQPISIAVPTGPTAARGIPATWSGSSRGPLRSTIRPPALTPTPPTSPMPLMLPVPLKRPAPKHDRAMAWLKMISRMACPCLHPG